MRFRFRFRLEVGSSDVLLLDCVDFMRGCTHPCDV